MKAKISIIVAVYDTNEEYFLQCLDSLAAQTIKEIEIILIDDGSEPLIAQICDKYAGMDNRFRVIHKKNEGVSIASNLGIALATGEYITFVDNDDWIEPDMCEKAYRMIEKAQADAAVWLYYSNGKEFQIESPYIGKDEIIIEKENRDRLQAQIMDVFSDEEILISLLGANWGKLYKAELLKTHKEIRFPEHVMNGEDAIFTLYAFEHAERIIVFKEYLYHYRQNASSFTKRFQKNMIQDEQKKLFLFAEYIDRYKKKKCIDAYHQLVLLSITGIIQNYILHKDNPEGYINKRRLLMNILKTEPYKSEIRRIDVKGYSWKKCIFYFTIKYKMIDIGILLCKVYKSATREMRFE